MDWDPYNDALGIGRDGNPIHLQDIWPSSQEVADVVGQAVRADMFHSSYADVFKGDERWNGLDVPTGDRFAWDAESAYVRQPPFFEDLPTDPEPVRDVEGARVLAKHGDSVATAP